MVVVQASWANSQCPTQTTALQQVRTAMGGENGNEGARIIKRAFNSPPEWISFPAPQNSQHSNKAMNKRNVETANTTAI